MEISFYKILIPILSVLMITRSISHFRRDKHSVRELFFHLIFWSGVTLLALYPDFFIDYFARFTGFKSGINGILFFLILVLSLLVIHLLNENENRSEEVTRITRYLSLKESQESSKK